MTPIPLIALALALLLTFLPGAAAHGAPAPEPLELSVMTFNIRYGTANDGADAWPHRRAMVVDVIREHDPDVVGLQEALAFQLDELLDALPGYASVGVGRNDGRAAGEYTAILYRPARFDLAESATFWLSDTPDVPGSKSWGNAITRICTSARLVERDTGRALYIYNTHFDHISQPSRERSAELLLDRIAARAHPDPVLVTGDFNAGESNPAVRRMTSDDRTPLIDTFRAAHPDAPEAGTFNAFKGATDGDKIDYIFAEPATEVLAAQIVRTSAGGRYPSDHFPVTARLRLAPVGTTPHSPATRNPAPSAR